ncbi:MAG: hypothetical protein COV48_06190 [Elusimicrobia bacterium CG11_big_fil_rev_8_21_14_0_20_64_6]|nr:MAG: hypothetical protein COV48_06190 [Elusimicrobia bacterium CG11_big_fil_rev_8_21_14_0_20_64_6]
MRQVGPAGLELRDAPRHDLELSGEFRNLLTGMTRLRLARLDTRRKDVAEILLEGRVLKEILGKRVREFIVADDARGIDLQLIEKPHAGGQGLKALSGAGRGNSRQAVELSGGHPRAPRGIADTDKGARVEAGKARHGLLIEGTENASFLINPILHSGQG